MEINANLCRTHNTKHTSVCCNSSGSEALFSQHLLHYLFLDRTYRYITYWNYTIDFALWVRFMINLLLLTGGIVIFIVAWNNGMKLEAEYMIISAAKLASFGLMALFWGLYSSIYRRHLEAATPESKNKHTW